MSTIPTGSTQSLTGGAQAAGTAASQTGKTGTPASATSIEMKVKSESNVQILKASLEVSINSGNQSQQLVFRAAIDKINEELEPSLGPDAIQHASNQDNSPEATAARIVAMSTGLYGAYSAQHPGEDPKEVAKKFVDIIRSGVDKGFKEGRDILKSLNVLQGDVASNIDKTYDLVQKGLDSFLSKMTGTDASGGGTGTGADKNA
ncbi:DUF5610 domain-containing protein [Paludibacterium paludis]|uniref:DUF5610 domain-containing protein n=1 Tax=Paludibacterium paludis TaxID=1225769 RepID=A0A918P0G8_9NEIS|nr:DUF5610 domain-containing protein [Paludibacterium paludis]GGY10542.1 hypothetical protein GCM10011289_11630 [Paludibacterium paludis]